MNHTNAQILFKKSKALFEKKKFQSSLSLLESNPVEVKNSIELNNLKGNLEYHLGKIDSALSTFSQSLEIDSLSFDAWHNRGLCAEKLGEKMLAIRSYERAFSLKPYKVEPLRAVLNLLTQINNFNRGDALIRNHYLQVQDKTDLSEIAGTFYYQHRRLTTAKKLLANSLLKNGENFNALNNLALVHSANNEEIKAVSLLERLIELKSDHTTGALNLGIIHKKLGNTDKAIKNLQIAKAIDPSNVYPRLALAGSYFLLGHYSIALKEYKSCLDLGVKTPKIYFDIGNCEFNSNNFLAAVDYYNKCIAKDPRHRNARFNLAVCLMQSGNFEKSIDQIKKVIEVDPSYAEAYRLLVGNKAFGVSEEFIEKIKKLISECANDGDKISYCWTLHISYERLKDFEQSFSWLQRGSSLRSEISPHSIDEDMKVYNFIRKNISRYASAKLNREKTRLSSTPIFIVGMPRSGTTLLEQIFAAHDDIDTGGELRCVEEAFHKIKNQQLSSVNDEIRFFRETYLSSIPNKLMEKSYFVDKMPQNFMFVPLLCAAFPEAKIIHIFRSPEATCWSNYKQYFVSNSGMSFANNLEHTIEYFNSYINLMQEWQALGENKFINLDYELLTQEPEKQIKHLWQLLDIKWQDNVLFPHLTNGNVKTASQYQVRQPIYKQSSQAWRNYEAWLATPFKSLQSFPETWPRV